MDPKHVVGIFRSQCQAEERETTIRTNCFTHIKKFPISMRYREGAEPEGPLPLRPRQEGSLLAVGARLTNSSDGHKFCFIYEHLIFVTLI